MGKKKKTAAEGNLDEFLTCNELSTICSEIKGAESPIDTEVLNRFTQCLEQFINQEKSARINDIVDIRLLTTLLTSYEAYRTTKDLEIYNIFENLESKQAIDLSGLQPFVWGNPAKEHYRKLAALGSSLHRISPNQIVDLLNESTVWNTVKSHSKSELSRDIYDERFLMRVFASVLYPASELSNVKFIERNCLSLTFSCTSSKDCATRTLAYYNLQKFLSLLLELKEEQFKQKQLYIYVIRLFKQSIVSEAPRISHLISHFFARVAKLLLHPEYPAYGQILSFLCQKPQIDLNNIPEFYRLLLSTSVEYHKDEREWILQLISEAIIDPVDYSVLQNRSGIKILLALFYSCISDQNCRKFVLATLKAACSIPSAAYDLFHRCNLHSWISLAITNPKLTRWEQNYLAQIFVILLENEKIAGAEKRYSEDVVAHLSAKLTAISVTNVLKTLAATEAVSIQHLKKIEKLFQL